MTQAELYRDLADDLDAYREECVSRGLPMDDARRLEYCSRNLRRKAEVMERTPHPKLSPQWAESVGVDDED